MGTAILQGFFFYVLCRVIEVGLIRILYKILNNE
jgi:hypothetical protein